VVGHGGTDQDDRPKGFARTQAARFDHAFFAAQLADEHRDKDAAAPSRSRIRRTSERPEDLRVD
jgi:hypothetical protein